MNNDEKKYLAALEARILRLEHMIHGITHGIEQAAAFRPSCNQCGVYDPAAAGYVCSVKGCCQGLNPGDDYDGTDTMQAGTAIDELIKLREWRDKAFEAHPNIDLDIENLAP